MKQPAIVTGPGYHLRVWRAERNLTIREAAKLFRVTASHLSLVEAGKRLASPTLAYRMAQATKAPIETFLGVRVSR